MGNIILKETISTDVLLIIKRERGECVIINICSAEIKILLLFVCRHGDQQKRVP